MSIYNRLNTTSRRLLAKYDTRTSTNASVEILRPLTTELLNPSNGTFTTTSATCTTTGGYIVATDENFEFNATRKGVIYTLSTIIDGDSVSLAFVSSGILAALGVNIQKSGATLYAIAGNLIGADISSPLDITSIYTTGDNLLVAISTAGTYGTVYLYHDGDYETPILTHALTAPIVGTVNRSVVYIATLASASLTATLVSEKRFGNKLTIQRRAAGTKNSSTGVFTQGALSEIEITGIVSQYAARLINGTTIKSGDMQVIADSENEIRASDEILIDGSVYKVIDLIKVKPSDTVILYKAQVRK